MLAIKDLDDIDVWSHQNWMKVPYQQRQACLRHLKAYIPPELLEEWKREYTTNFSIGHNDVRFHFSTGMAVRNLLRDRLRDEDLPAITQRHLPRRWWGLGPRPTAKNWDDFYMGALQDFVEQELAKASKPA